MWEKQTEVLSSEECLPSLHVLNPTVSVASAHSFPDMNQGLYAITTYTKGKLKLVSLECEWTFFCFYVDDDLL